MNEEPAWKAERALYDSHDDGDGPWAHSWFDKGCMEDWKAFRKWAADNLGQGYSMACNDGQILDPVTNWCFAGFRAGLQLGKQ